MRNEANETSEPDPNPAGDRLERQLKTLKVLAKEMPSLLARPETALERVTEHLAFAADVERTSIWKLSNDGKTIASLDLFLKSKGVHEEGASLSAKDYPSYWTAFMTQQSIVASDAQNHPATSEMAEDYLIPNSIVSMLDVPIWVDNEMCGIICHEHVGDSLRQWTKEHENYAYMVGNIVSEIFRKLGGLAPR